MPRVITPVLLSYPPINISHRFFRWIYLNSRDVVASSRSVPAPLSARTPRRACSQVNQPSPLDSTGALLQILSIRGKKNSKLFTNRKRFKIGYLSSMTNVRFAKLNTKHYSPFSFTVCTQICKFSQLCGPISPLPNISFNFGTFTNFKALFSVVSTDFP